MIFPASMNTVVELLVVQKPNFLLENDYMQSVSVHILQSRIMGAASQNVIKSQYTRQSLLERHLSNYTTFGNPFNASITCLVATYIFQNVILTHDE